MRVRKILALFLFSFFVISALFSGCNSSPQSQSSSKTNAAQSKQETSVTGSYSVTDLTGTRVTFTSKPKKILTFAMYTDQIVLGLVTSDHLVGINTLLDDPVLSNIIPIAKKITKKIGNPSAEEVLSMKPDLVIVSDWPDDEFDAACEKIRGQMESLSLGADGKPVLFSGGYVCGVPRLQSDLRLMMRQADDNLYKAKREGRDMVVGSKFDRATAQTLVGEGRSVRFGDHA